MIELGRAGIAALTAPIVVATATATSAGLILALRPLLERYALARPNSRSSHREPTAQGGGIAIVAATVVVVAAAVAYLPQFGMPALGELAPVLVATAFIALVGAVDDIHPIAVAPRLLLQTLAVAAVIAALPPDLRVVSVLPWWVERVCLVLGLLWFVNLVNFMDGIDWMTVAEVVPITCGLVLIGALGALPPRSIFLALALFGAMLGFAPFNRPVARLFLGDVGSLPIGLLTGWLLIEVAGSGHLAAALLLPLYYLADATITLLRRLLDGEPIWEAHRRHFYQRAADRGLPVAVIVGRVFALNVGLAALAALTVFHLSLGASLGALVAGAALTAWLLASFARGSR